MRSFTVRHVECAAGYVNKEPVRLSLIGFGCNECIPIELKQYRNMPRQPFQIVDRRRELKDVLMKIRRKIERTEIIIHCSECGYVQTCAAKNVPSGAAGFDIPAGYPAEGSFLGKQILDSRRKSYGKRQLSKAISLPQDILRGFSAYVIFGSAPQGISDLGSDVKKEPDRAG